MRIDGGAPETICDAAFGFGAAWSEDGTIVFGGSLTGGLSRVSAQGGEPVQFTTPAKGELVHRWPTFLPGGREILFAVASDVTNWLGARIAVQLPGHLIDRRQDRKSTRLNSSHLSQSRMPSSA